MAEAKKKATKKTAAKKKTAKKKTTRKKKGAEPKSRGLEPAEVQADAPAEVQTLL